MMNSQYNHPIVGRVSVWDTSRPDEPVQGQNAVLYSGADLLARILSGEPLRISHVWFEINNGGPATPAAVDRADNAASRIAAAVGSLDIVRGQLVGPAGLSATGVDYASNQATFTALTGSDPGFVNSQPLVGSWVYAVCLAASVAPADPSQDILYARYLLGTQLEVTGSQVSATWSTEMT